jgi:fatty acid desaturase
MKMEREPMARVRATFKVDWYRCPVAPDQLKRLTKRSDLKGALQAFGYLALLVALGMAAWYFAAQRLWGLLAIALFAYGTVCSFNPGLATHELSHGTVFKTKWPNAVFLRFFSLLGWTHFHQYKRSHTFHHLFTLHPRGDREVVLPLTPSLHPVRLLFLFTFNFPGLWAQLKATVRLAFLGKLWNEWSEAVVPAEDAGARRKARAWAWTILVFHAALIAVSVVFQLWLLPVLVTFGMYLANWWSYFVGMPMHAGLRDNVADFRLCCRTITLDPFSRFIYWHMSFHTEHHMYAAVPCYNLSKLSRTIAADMPKPRTLIQAWKEMRDAYRRQKAQPDYQFDTPLPPRGAKGKAGKAAAPDALGASLGNLAPEER